MSDLKERIEKLKKEGKIPPDTEILTKPPKPEDAGKHVVFTAKVGETSIKVSPPIVVVDKVDGVECSVSPTPTLLDYKVRFENSYLYIGFKAGAKQRDVLDYFNNAIALFNIISVPFDFVSASDLIVKMKGLGTQIEALTSSKAHYRGYGLEPIKIEGMTFTVMLGTIGTLWERIKQSEFFKNDNSYQFLGYASYYDFHWDYFLSFIHSWLFIESSINMMWAKMIEDTFPEEPEAVSKNKWKDYCGPPTSSERNWTTQIKTDELYLKGHIQEELREEIHVLRSKRNKVLHQEKKGEQRIVKKEDAIMAIKVGHLLFHKMLGFGKDDKIIGFTDIRNRMYQGVHRGRLLRPAGKKKTK